MSAPAGSGGGCSMPRNVIYLAGDLILGDRQVRKMFNFGFPSGMAPYRVLTDDKTKK